MTLINFSWSPNGTPTDADSVVFSDPTGVFGLIRRDTGEILVLDGTPVPRIGVGTYQYNLADPDPMPSGYEYWVEVLYLSNLTRRQFKTGSGAAVEPLVPAPVDAFTSLAEIERYLSVQGVNLRVDDAEDVAGEFDIINEIINDATEIVEQYTWGQYDRQVLASAQWVRRRATLIGAHLLSMRRGNPSPFFDRYQQVISELQMVLQRQISIPNIYARESGTPTLSNYTMDNRAVAPVCRVDPHRSVGSYPGQKTTTLTPDVI